jgi:hypothetical protein
MRGIKLFELGEPGLAYMSAWLRYGALCGSLGKLPLSTGRIFAPLPSDTTSAQAMRIKMGRLPGASPRKWLINHVVSMFEKVPQGTLILEDVIGARPSDPGALATESRTLLTKERVYYAVTKENASARSVDAALNDVAGLELVGALSRFEIPLGRSKEPQTVPDSLIVQLAEEALEIYVSAYDGEGFVVWQRQ